MVMRAEMLSALAIWRYFSEGGGRGGQIENKKYYVGKVFISKDLHVGQLFVATVVKAFCSGPSFCLSQTTFAQIGNCADHTKCSFFFYSFCCPRGFAQGNKLRTRLSGFLYNHCILKANGSIA